MDLPLNRRGNTWFWGLLGEGESGAELSHRLRPHPPDTDQDKVQIWTKVSGGHTARAIVGVRGDRGLTPYGCGIEGETVVEGD